MLCRLLKELVTKVKEVDKQIPLVQEEIVLDRLQSVQKSVFVKQQTQKLLGCPFIHILYGLLERLLDNEPDLLVLFLVDLDVELRLVRVFDVTPAFSEHVQVLATVKDLIGQFLKEHGDHFFPIRVLLLPVLIVKVLRNVVLVLVLVLNYQKLAKRVVQLPIVNPLLKYLKERHGRLLQQKPKKLLYGPVASIGQKLVNHVQKRPSLLIDGLLGQLVQVLHDPGRWLDKVPYFLEGQVAFHELGV